MTQTQDTPASQHANIVHQAEENARRLKFGKNNSFYIELRRRVDEFFQTTGRRQRDCPQMYVKTAILVSCFAAAYVLLVCFATAWWQAVPLAVFLGLVTAGIGCNMQHDGGHQAYSNHAWINKLMAMSLDFIGGSSYAWHWKHAVFHHTDVNITGHDTDIDLGIFGRMTPHQKRRPFHRWQHYYLWPLYGLLAIKWHFMDDFKDVMRGRIGQHRIPRPKGWDLAVFLGGKAVFFTLALGFPLLFHSIWVVLLFYAVTAIVLGLALSVIFQLAHCVEDADFPMPELDTGRIENAWAIHQVQTTVDFARRSRVWSWLLGGLNYQIEHHLFPRVCHVNYPALSKVVEATCREFQVRYKAHDTFRAGLASHFRWLREMGKSPEIRL